LSLNRPRVHNALDSALLLALKSHLHTAAEDPAVKVVVLDGKGKSFCSGGDLEQFLALNSRHAVRNFIGLCFATFQAIEDLAKPVIASVHGVAYGGGTELAAAADIVIAAKSARFATVEPMLGLTPGFGVTRLKQVIGLHNAKFMAMTGREVTATAAQRMGLVNIVVDDGRLKDATAALAAELASYDPSGISASKRLLNRASRDGLAEALAAVVDLQLADGLKERVQKQLGGRRRRSS
jgi:enoyl-CoA hydratase